MKTKAYKLKENIARYIYNYIGRNDVSICWDNSSGVYQRWVVHLTRKTWKQLFGKKKNQHDTYFIKRKRDELENILGITITLSDGEYGRTLLWNKEKEIKYLKRQPNVHVLEVSKDELIEALSKGEDDFIKYFGELIDRVAEIRYGPKGK